MDCNLEAGQIRQETVWWIFQNYREPLRIYTLAHNPGATEAGKLHAYLKPVLGKGLHDVLKSAR
jgi:hypothetical protein